MSKNLNSYSQPKIKNWNRNFFIDINENLSTKTFASKLFHKIRDNFTAKPTKIQLNSIAMSNSNLHPPSSPKSNLISNKSKLILKDSTIQSPRESQRNKTLNNPPTSKNFRSMKRNIKSYDFFWDRPLDYRQMTEMKTTKTQLSDIMVKDSKKSKRIIQSRSLAKDDFLKTVTGFMEIKDKNSFLLEILEKKDEDSQIFGSLQNNNFIEFEKVIQNKRQRIERLYNENFDKASNSVEGNVMFIDLMKLLYQELLKITGYYDCFLRQNKRSSIHLPSDNSKINPKLSIESKESLNLLAALELLMKIHSPYNSENRIKLQEINEDYHKEYKLIFNHFLYDTQTEVFQKSLTKLEGNFKHFEVLVDNLLSKIDLLNHELESFQEILNKNIIINKIETKELLEKKFKVIELDEKNPKNNKRSCLDMIESYNEIMIKNMKRLEEENEELLKQQGQMRKNTTFHEDSPRRKNVKKAKTAEKETQIFFQEVLQNNNELIKDENSLQRILRQSIVYYKYKDDDIVSIINLILNEKLINDYNEIQERHKILPLDLFIRKWFILKMGNPEIANLMLRDLLMNIKDNVFKNPRYSLFLQLCGIEYENYNDSPSSNNPKKSEKKEYRKKFLSSSYACKILIKAAYLLRYAPKVEEIDPYSSLFPNANTDGELQKYKILTTILKDILVDEGVTDSGFQEEILRNFQKFCTKVKVNSLPSEGTLNPRRSSLSMTTSISRNSTVSTDILIKFDHFMKFVLDFFADEFQQKMEHLCILLKLVENSRNQGRVFIEDFKAVILKIVGNVSGVMMDCLYEKFVELNSALQIPNFSEIGQILAKEILEGISYDEFYIPEKIEEKSQKKAKNNIFNQHNLEKFCLFAKRENESPAEVPFVYNQNNPENYKIWNLLDKTNDSFIISNYDIVDSLFFVNLIYDYIRVTIKEKEEKNDSLYTYNEIWKKEFFKLPIFQGLRNLKRYAGMFSNWDRGDLIQKIQMNWNLIRLINDSMFMKINEP